MKKVLLLGLILAILLLAFPQGVMAATGTPQNVPVNANVVSAISCTASGPAQQALTRGSNNELATAFTGTVISTNNWQLVATDQKTTPTTEVGYMVPTTGFAPSTGPKALVAPFAIQTSGAAYSPLTSPVTVALGAAGSNPYTKGMQQPVGNDDWMLTTGTYQITIVFACSTTDTGS
jgi:hypothetical protein